MGKDDLGNRMKEYEATLDHVVPPNLPLIVRLDGRAFHAISPLFEQPFDAKFKDGMYAGAKALLNEFSGGRIAYVQSDEATLLFINDSRDNKTRFFNYRVQKICSVFASLFATTFYYNVLDARAKVSFDCRCFVVPKDDVNNMFVWRQKDAIKNAATSILYYVLRNKGMRGKEASMHMQGKTPEAMFKEAENLLCRDIGSVYPLHYLRGACVKMVTKNVPVKEMMEPSIYKIQLEKGHVHPGQTATRRSWETDYDIPLFWERKEYIEDLL